MNIRTASMQDIEEISAIENECFPPEQACTKEQFKQRLTYYPEHFWLWEKDGKIISFVDGFCTHEENPKVHEVEPGHFVRCTCWQSFHFQDEEKKG